MRANGASQGKIGRRGKRTSKNTGDHGRRSAAGILSPPKYPRKEHRIERFGDFRTDPFYWMHGRRNPEVRRLLQHENAYMESVFAKLGGDQLFRTLFSEMRAHWKEGNASVPYRDRSCWYFSRNPPNAAYPIFCRRPFTEQTAGFMHEVGEMWGRDPLAPLPVYDDEVV
ncbi:putative oligopeptidase B, putative,serine peptidase, clan SC, family S9A-like protein [Trypanosoma cruzi]|nr:putative oligopeptidase B, putative,serine peptidase, clan SC, family S9A-like protein [Trypanosoma cruzi]